MNKYISTLLVAMGLLLAGMNSTQAAVPALYHFQGVLTDNQGALLEGQYSVTLSLYDAAQATTPVWSQTTVVQLVGGVVDVELGQDGSPVTVDMLGACAPGMALELEVSHEDMTNPNPGP